MKCLIASFAVLFSLYAYAAGSAPNEAKGDGQAETGAKPANPEVYKTDGNLDSLIRRSPEFIDGASPMSPPGKKGQLLGKVVEIGKYDYLESFDSNGRLMALYRLHRVGYSLADMDRLLKSKSRDEFWQYNLTGTIREMDRSFDTSAGLVKMFEITVDD